MFIKKLFTLWFLLSIIVCGGFFFFANVPIQYAEKSNVSLAQPTNDELLGYMQHYQFLMSDIAMSPAKRILYLLCRLWCTAEWKNRAPCVNT
ncbi:hypothetical protein AABM34_13305 [Lysinibacillus fusiformis]